MNPARTSQPVGAGLAAAGQWRADRVPGAPVGGRGWSGPAAPWKVTAYRALAAQWCQVVTLPASWGCGLAAVLLSVLASLSVRQQVPVGVDFGFSQAAWAWVMFPQVAFLALGLVLSGAEHSCAQGRMSLLVLPVRGAVWAARVLVTGALALVVALVLGLLAAWACPAGLTGQVVVLARVVLWLGLAALLGLGAGEVLRSPTAAGVTALCLVVVAPAAKQVLGYAVVWLPGAAASEWVSGVHTSRAAVVLAAWAVAAVLGGGVRLMRTEA
ncbi:Uncharacterised protein [Actinomyces bovis]|uniref:ABC-2 family transporter protein n=1 Tax=Actinomyces bovis TaxID=1658 RepID=A0ABY1VNX3_9ACTO|nr:cupin [Actinomyces bovis]SPT53675.1 Uncharacterised protein [Actinomyces bovis]VEG55780.1 Uncharacterised protein [Actinomyces israelii]